MRNLIDVRKESVRLFIQLSIETSSRCNRTCVFCPNKGTDRPEEFLPESLFSKMVAELKEIDYRGRIELFIYNEPLRDKRLPQLIQQIKEELPRVCCMTSSNGDYFKSKEDIEKLFDCGLRQLVINVYSTGDGSDNEKRYQTGIKNAEARYQLLKSWIDRIPGVDQKRSPYHPVGAGAKVIRIERKFGIQTEGSAFGVFKLQNRSGNIPWFAEPLAAPLKKNCTRPWRSLNINWKGDAILCCNDYHGITNFGNVARNSLVEIWNSEGFNQYRLMLQNHNRHLDLCDKCDYPGGAYIHLLDQVTFGKQKDAAFLAQHAVATPKRLFQIT